jgi:hypothetical protein
MHSVLWGPENLRTAGYILMASGATTICMAQTVQGPGDKDAELEEMV